MTSPDTELLMTEPEEVDEAPEAALSGPVLTDAYTDDELEEMGRAVLADFDADIESCEPHLRECAHWMKLYESIMEKKTFPFDKAATVNVPALLSAVLQIWGRLFDMVRPAKGNMYHAVPLHYEPDEMARSNRTESMANYWANHQCVEFNPTLEMLLWRMALFGSSFSVEDWSEAEGRPVYECVPVEDMVVPWDAKSTRPDMLDVPRYTWVRKMSFWDISSSMEDGFFRSADIDPEEGDESSRESAFAQLREKISGLTKARSSNDPKDSLRKVLVHYRKLVLPDAPERHESFDGKAHPVRIWVDHETGAVLRIVLREEADPRDAQRYQKEKQAWDQYQMQMASFEATGGFTVDPMTGAEVPLPLPEPMEEPKPQRMRELTYHTHYKAFPSEGYYGLGYGKIVGPLNEAMNTTVNQRIDLMTIQNAGGGYKSRQLRFPSGPQLLQPGLWIDVDATPDALKNGLVPRPNPTPDPQTVQFLEMFETWVQRSTGSGDTLSGEPVKSNETAAAAQLRNDAAIKQISVLASRVVQSYMKNDANMLWRLFATYLPDDDYTFIVDEKGQPQKLQVSRRDFSVEGRVYPVADPRVITKQDRVNVAKEFLAFAAQHPMLTQNPKVQYYAITNYLTAMDMQEVLGMLEPPQPPPPKPQTVENADFLRGQQPKVHPQDNDMEHLSDMEAFKVSPEFMAMTPEQQKVYEQHGREHIASKMEKDFKNGQAHQSPGIQGMDPVGGNAGAGLMPS